MTTRAFFAASLLAIGAYTAAIEAQRRSIESSSSSSSSAIAATMPSPLSTDELVMESLQTGDLLLFQRDWKKYHLPTAAMIAMYRIIFSAEFDHAAVVIVDKKGDVFVLECSPWKGLQYRPFQKRIAQSLAKQILLIPVVPVIKLNTEERDRLCNHYKEVAERKSTASSGSKGMEMKTNEIALFLRSLLRFAYTGHFLCPSTSLICDVFQQLGYKTRIQNATSTATSLKQFYDREVVFEHLKLQKESLTLLEQNILIRSK